MTNDEKIAALEREVAALKAKAEPPPKSTFVPMSDAEHRDWVHQMRERRMSMATPPSVRQYFANQDDRMVKEVTLRDARAPTGPSSQGVIPSTQQVSNVHVGGASSTPGYVDPTPLGVPGGARTQELIERAVNAALPHGPEWGKGKK
jgi:hypothetical protein